MARDENQTLEMLTELAAKDKFSGALRLRIDGELLVDHAFGLADRESGRSNQPTTMFAIASGCKLFTALAIGSLIDDGTFALSSRLVDLVSMPLADVSADVTIEHLLAHTSGVYDYYDEDAIEDFDAFELPLPPATLLAPIDYLPMLVAGPAKFAPGARFSYSNGGYVFLGLVLTEQTGKSYQSVVRERVFQRASMDRSDFFRLDELPQTAAFGYVDATDGSWRTNETLLPIIGGPDGGAFSSTGDMEKLWHALFSNQLLSAELTERFLTPAASYKDTIAYGHGVYLETAVTPPRAYIEGADAGVSFKSTRYGAETVATVVSNSSEGAWAIADAIDEVLSRGGR